MFDWMYNLCVSLEHDQRQIDTRHHKGETTQDRRPRNRMHNASIDALFFQELLRSSNFKPEDIIT